jgi:hypothetical protein
MIPKGLYQFVKVTAHCFANHTLLLVLLLQLTRSKGLGKAAAADGFELGDGIKVGKEGVASTVIDGQMGDPLVPDTSTVRFELGHDPGVADKLSKVELIHVVIGRGGMQKPARICLRRNVPRGGKSGQVD